MNSFKFTHQGYIKRIKVGGFGDTDALSTVWVRRLPVDVLLCQLTVNANGGMSTYNHNDHPDFWITTHPDFRVEILYPDDVNVEIVYGTVPSSVQDSVICLSKDKKTQWSAMYCPPMKPTVEKSLRRILN